jgi:hypothetical protein
VAATPTAGPIADYIHYNSKREQQSIRLGRQAGIRAADALDSTLSSIAARAQEYALEVPAISSEQDLLESIRRESLEFPPVLGVTVATQVYCQTTGRIGTPRSPGRRFGA